MPNCETKSEYPENRFHEWFWNNLIRDVDVSRVRKIPGVHCFRFLKEGSVRYGVEIFVPDEIRIPKRKTFLVLNTHYQEIKHLDLQQDAVTVLFDEHINTVDCFSVFVTWSKRFPTAKWNHKNGLREPFKHSQDITDGTHRKALKMFESFRWTQ